MTGNRRKRNKAGIIWLFLMLIWLMVIFSFSAKKADESTVMSHSVGKLIGNIVIPEYRSWPEDKQEQFAEKIDFPVRKCAHASEYAVLGVLMLGLRTLLRKIREKRTDYYAGVQVRHTQQQMNSINYSCPDAAVSSGMSVLTAQAY